MHYANCGTTGAGEGTAYVIKPIKGELVVYPFFEAYVDDDFEYKPEELGAIGDVDYRGRYRAKEGLVMIAYGVSDRVAVEFEVAGISATLDKAPGDPSALPSRIKESGLGDVEGQVRWRWNRERTIRAQARALYAKAGLSGRAALSAFFLEDLMAPIGPIDAP